MDDRKAYLIGNNVHFIYRHGIYKDFVTYTQDLLFEFVDVGMQDITKMKSISNYEDINYYHLHTINNKGIRLYRLYYEQPSITC